MSPAPSTFGGFGNQQQSQMQTGGNLSTPFGGGSTSFHAPSSGFLNSGGTQLASVSDPPAFGASPSMYSGFNSSPPNSTPMTGLGGPQTPFSTQAPAPFGQSNAFPIASSISFGNSSALSSKQAPSAPNPFGASTAAPNSSISFGVSSNIAPSPFGRQSFGTINTSTPFSSASPAFGASTSTVNVSPAFGIPSSFAPSGFGGMQSDNNDDMMDGGDGATDVANTSSGASSTSFASSSPWSSNDRASSPEPSGGGMQDSSMSPTPASKGDELAQLKAKKAEILRKKKKKLEELKRRKEAAAASADNAASASSLNAGAPPFFPTETRSRNTDRPEETAFSLADRNSARFAKPDLNDSLLPEDLRNRTDAIVSGYKDDGPGETKNIGNAVSLVGTCPYMCPDDELIRRQKEGDIQLLETPQPGTLHPNNWTLRDTAVKRFRRSAADYKLDVPAWVRPPDVLEVVCGYLEEWVMVRFLFSWSCSTF